MQNRVSRLLHGKSFDMPRSRVEQRQHLSGPSPNILMRLLGGLAFVLPTRTGLRNRLIGTHNKTKFCQNSSSHQTGIPICSANV